jgi:ribosome biogenesis SPOUT family RNA methylase Rps3
MTTDTAVRVTRIVVQDKISLEKIPYVDHPEIRVDAHESTTMPFRYVVDQDGGPVMPEVWCFFLLRMRGANVRRE